MAERQALNLDELEMVAGGRMNIQYDGKTGEGVITSTATGGTYTFSGQNKAAIYAYLYSMSAGTTETQAVNDLIARGLIR